MSCTFDFKLTSHAKIQPAFTSFWLSHHSLALVTLYVQFYALIGQNLTGEFMRKIYAAFRKVFTDSWSWQSFFVTFAMFLTLFLYWIYKMKYSCYQDPSVIYGWFVCCAFGWKMHRLSKSLEIRFRMVSFSNWAYSLALVRGVRGLNSLKRFWPHLMAIRSSISTGNLEQ